jgi:hypothetical protein
LNIGPNSDVVFLTDKNQLETLEVTNKESIVFTIQPAPADIKVITETIGEIQSDSDNNSENSDKQSQNESSIHNDIIILKNPESKTVLETLLKISQNFKDSLPEGDDREIMISAYKISPNNFYEKPVYDKSSDDVRKHILFFAY